MRKAFAQLCLLWGRHLTTTPQGAQRNGRPQMSAPRATQWHNTDLWTRRVDARKLAAILQTESSMKRECSALLCAHGQLAVPKLLGPQMRISWTVFQGCFGTTAARKIEKSWSWQAQQARHFISWARHLWSQVACSSKAHHHTKILVQAKHEWMRNIGTEEK